jgi:signal transduction histidine kinase
LAFFIAAITLSEFVNGFKKIGCLVLEGCFALLLIIFIKQEFAILLAIWILDIVSIKKVAISWYLTAFLTFLFLDYNMNQLLIVILIIMIYLQNAVVIRSYKEQQREDELSEWKLKQNLNRNESRYKEEISKSLLSAENSILEEKSRLSQSLHDKLGHSINGSIYQLEACKVIMDKDKKTCERMIQAVIDNLRNSMDEIREILSKERPDKYKLVMLQLQSLCDDCKKIGINANFSINGNLSDIPHKYLEIILDNAFEAVSNALKYAKCTKFDIKIIVLNQMVRCTISDNGVGCEELIDGMGLSGMRNRMRSVNGILDFASELGFSINMLFPLEHERG